MMSLAPAPIPHYANETINGTTAFLFKVIKMRCNMNIGHAMPLVPLLASHNVSGLVNSTIAFIGSR